MITSANTKDAALQLSDVSETGLLTLYCRAQETLSTNPILKDDKAVEITRALNPLLEKSGDSVLRSLARGHIRSELVVHISLRAQKYDDYARDFLARHPDGVIVNLGCGLDSRCLRLGGVQPAHFFDLDLPEMVRVREHFFQDGGHYHQLGVSVFDHRWMDTVQSCGPRPALFLAEGLFMYLDPEKVKDLVLTLQKRFPGAELVAEMVHKRWIGGFLGSMVRFKMQRQLSLGRSVTFTFGIDGSRELETWNSGIRLLDEWSYFDSRHPKLGWLSRSVNIPALRQVQWTAHYLLGEAPAHAR